MKKRLKHKPFKKLVGLVPGQDVFSPIYGDGYIIELLDKKGYKGDAIVSFNIFNEHIHVSLKSLSVIKD